MGDQTILKHRSYKLSPLFLRDMVTMQYWNIVVVSDETAWTLALFALILQRREPTRGECPRQCKVEGSRIVVGQSILPSLEASAF